MNGRITGRVSLMLVAAVAASLALLGCEDEESNYRRPSSRPRPGQSSIDAKKRIAEKGAGLVEGGAEAAKGDLELPKLSETDFIEGPKHRDPFKPHLEMLARQTEVQQTIQREIKLKEYDIGDLRLIAIITNVGDPRAMVVTPASEGIVLRRGDYVGKADFVDPGGGGEKIQVNWRVARIHGSGKEEERGVYLVRDDPLTQTPEDVTRFMALHPAK